MAFKIQCFVFQLTVSVVSLFFTLVCGLRNRNASWLCDIHFNGERNKTMCKNDIKTYYWIYELKLAELTGIRSTFILHPRTCSNDVVLQEWKTIHKIHTVHLYRCKCPRSWLSLCDAHKKSELPFVFLHPLNRTTKTTNDGQMWWLFTHCETVNVRLLQDGHQTE